jgi:hypothetical protein
LKTLDGGDLCEIGVRMAKLFCNHNYNW